MSTSRHESDGMPLQFLMFTSIVAVVLAIAPACAQVQWKLAAGYPSGNFHTENLNAFAQEVTDTTGGKVLIKTYPNGSLFPAIMIKRAVRVGQAEIGEVLISLHESEEPTFGIDVVPFLATSYDEARRLWAASRPAIERKFASQGLVLLFAVPWPPQGLYSTRQINNVSDLQGLSWRVYNDATLRIGEILGAIPVTIQAAELRQALETGLIDALMNSGSTGYDVKVWDFMHYYYDIQAWIPKNITFMNKAAFDRLEVPVQQSLLRIATNAEARGWRTSQDKNKWYIEQLAAKGLKVLPPSDSLQAGLRQIGKRLSAEWLAKAGADAQSILDEYQGAFPK
jgi:TRAP-type C4-dicarboxylate transport system substrate-binding protein